MKIVERLKGLTGLRIVILMSSAVLVGCGESDKVEVPIVTQLNYLLDEADIKCKQPLLTVGNDLIGEKKHHLQLMNVPYVFDTSVSEKKTETVDDEDNDVEQSAQATTHGYVNHQNHAVISGVLEYNDRPSHVRFDAYYLENDPVKVSDVQNVTENDNRHHEMSHNAVDTNQNNQINANKSQLKSQPQCIVGYQLNYQLDIPCIDAREAFKRWQQIGDTNAFGKKTRYFVHQRKPAKKAYLTSISGDTQCLVSVQDIQSFSVSNL